MTHFRDSSMDDLRRASERLRVAVEREEEAADRLLVATRAERDRYRAALQNIAVGQYPGQFKHEPDPYSAYAHAVLEGPPNA